MKSCSDCPRTQDPLSPHQELPVAKVSDTLNTVITSLSQLDALGFIIRDLGRRHQRFNVHQFALLKQALTQVLARRLGSGFTAWHWHRPGRRCMTR